MWPCTVKCWKLIVEKEADVRDHGSDVVRLPPAVRRGIFAPAKRVVQAGCALWVLPRLWCYWLARRLLDRWAFSAASESIARLPGRRGVLLRQAFYRRTLRACGQDVYFG